MELHQRALLEKRSFFLLPTKLKLYLKDAEGEYENYIAYESLKSETQICCRKNPQLLFLTLLSGSLTISLIIHSLVTNQSFKPIIIPAIVTVILAILYNFKQQGYLILETFDRKKVIFLKDQPNRQALESFLAQLWLKRKQYLRDKYFYINPNQNLQQQTERLRWLLEQNVITKVEYQFAQEDWIIDRSYQSK
ncbi:hypothetical protein NIES4102_22710 [Chondrocystis sp. NIES-4102]|nr:hypothetical protein NIES4102_22710 [Chondrocystis sp. NIES-4102]